MIYDSVAGDRLNVETHTSDAVEESPRERASASPPASSRGRARANDHRHAPRRARPLRPHDRLPGAHLRTTGSCPALAPCTRWASIRRARSSSIPTARPRVLNAAGGRGAYLVRATALPHLVAGQPFRLHGRGLARASRRRAFDLLHKRTQGSVDRRDRRRRARRYTARNPTRRERGGALRAARAAGARAACRRARLRRERRKLRGIRVSRARRRQLGRLLSRHAVGRARARAV